MKIIIKIIGAALIVAAVVAILPIATTSLVGNIIVTDEIAIVGKENLLVVAPSVGYTEDNRGFLGYLITVPSSKKEADGINALPGINAARQVRKNGEVIYYFYDPVKKVYGFGGWKIPGTDLKPPWVGVMLT